jgi:serine/threonine-protein kinase
MQSADRSSGHGAPSAASPLVIGRYAIFDAIASGGMAKVHLGRLMGPVGFSRTVAIKRLHPQYAGDPDFTAMFLDEARLAARVQHPNVVPTLDVLQSDQELLLVMEYVRGESLSRLVRAARDQKMRLPPRIVVAIVSGALQGLHAAHEALDEKGKPLGLVHRDMSPQNVLVGVDGTARVLDFGVARAEGRLQTTREGQVKGKILYMPPEQLAAQPVTRTADIYAAGVLLFEALTGVRMFAGEDDNAAITRILKNDIKVPSEIDPELAPFDDVCRRATAAEPTHRFPTAREMAFELEKVISPSSNAEVGEWVQRLATANLDARARKVAEIESSTSITGVPTMPPASEKSGVKPAGVAPRSVPPPPQTSRTLVGALIGLGVLLVGAAVVIAYLLGTRGSATTAALPPAPSATTPPPPTVTAPPPATTESPPIASANPAPSAAPKPTAKPAPSPPIIPMKPAVNCNPPWTIDKQGHKHFIPECN